MEIKKFVNRITDIWDYPKLSIYENSTTNNDYFEFLDSKVEGNTFRLYVHVPFCSSFCSFCQFYKEGYNEEKGGEWGEKYLSSVLSELKFYSSKNYIRNSTVSSIFFGGGDPSIISNEMFEKIMMFIKDNYNVSENVSISIEGTARSLLFNDKLELYKKYNINRISFGIQTFNEEIRKQLHIRTTTKDIYDAVEQIKKLKFESFAFDLMYNLPNQTDEIIQDDIEKALMLKSEYIDFYSLNLYPNTKFFDDIYNNNKFEIKPNKERELHQNILIHEIMTKAGYDQVISCTYSNKFKTPHLGLYNYLKGEDMLGIGPSARSFIFGHAFRNVCSVRQYYEAVNDGIRPTEAGTHISQEEIVRRIIIMSVNLLKIDKRLADSLEDTKFKISQLIELGYIYGTEDDYMISQEGRAWVGNIQKVLFSDKLASSDVKNFLHAIKEGRSAYNQDYMSINKYK